MCRSTLLGTPCLDIQRCPIAAAFWPSLTFQVTCRSPGLFCGLAFLMKTDIICAGVVLSGPSTYLPVPQTLVEVPYSPLTDTAIFELLIQKNIILSCFLLWNGMSGLSSNYISKGISCLSYLGKWRGPLLSLSVTLFQKWCVKIWLNYDYLKNRLKAGDC